MFDQVAELLEIDYTDLPAVANLTDADLLAILTNIDGLYDKDPNLHADAALVSVVPHITSETEAMAGKAISERSRGGMVTKLQAARLVRAVESEQQLQEVMVDFWFNHFNVHSAKGEVRWYVTSYERDVIRPHALGRFPDLLRATARHPAMLFYLDNWLSVGPDSMRALVVSRRIPSLDANSGLTTEKTGDLVVSELDEQPG